MGKILQEEVKLELDSSLTQEEIKKAIAKLKIHKAPGIDSTPAEVYQDKFTDLFTLCWEKGTVPQDLCHVVIVSLYKTKGKK